MKKFPIICPKGSRVIITQGFSDMHDAIDFIIGDDKLTNRENARLSYGSQLVCPVPQATCVHLNDFGTMNELGNGIDIEWQEEGYYWRLHFWHTVYNELNIGEIATEGQIVALMGNTGDCRPKPTENSPYAGTHCHCRLTRYTKDQWDGNHDITSLDMRKYFDVLNPYEGVDSSVVVDLQPLEWAWKKLGITSNWEKLVYLFKNIFI